MESSASIYGQLVNFDKTAQNPIDIYNNALNTLGVADARTRVTGLRGDLINSENMLRAVEGNVSQRTSNAIMTEAQRQKLVTGEQAPIGEMMRTQNNSLNVASQNLSDIERQGTTQADLLYKGQQDKRAGLAERYSMVSKSEKDAEEKRQWEAQQAESTRRWQAEQAENTRRFNVEQATTRGASSYGGGGQPSNKELFAKSLADSTGGDGFVSPGTYNALKKQWVSSGYGTYKSFHDLFWKFTGVNQLGKKQPNRWKAYYNN
jgi:hypothetical protein